jgi:Ribonuclease G/E
MGTQSSLILTLVLAFGFMVSAFVFMVLILQSAAHEMQKKRLPDSWRKEFVKDCLHVGGTYRLQTKEKGKFGRYLGTIYLTDDTSINAALVTEHLAVPYHGQSKKEIEAAHKANYKILK